MARVWRLSSRDIHRFIHVMVCKAPQEGRPVELRDAMIAGIVLGSRATLATRNTTIVKISRFPL